MKKTANKAIDVPRSVDTHVLDGIAPYGGRSLNELVASAEQWTGIAELDGHREFLRITGSEV
jgi:hypothetical protein